MDQLRESILRAPVALAVLLVIAAGLGIYHEAASFGFLNWDDDVYLYGNPIVVKGLTAEGWRYAWSIGLPPYYMPLTWLSFMLDVELFGVDPGASHLVNVALHLATSSLLYLLLVRITQKPWPSLLAALLFVVHPLHVEAVAWISQRKEMLAALFAMISL
ncbi:MAG: hypothetical protein R3200_16765, partial [Xanthomonadales bacterium]|nr:hypothetical protein [Xanthomonadales bacterium]